MLQTDDDREVEAMLKIGGKVVGSSAPKGEEMHVVAYSEQGARLVQEETLGRCRFVISCGCGMYAEGSDGVQLWQAAKRHAAETGHKCFGHFMFEQR